MDERTRESGVDVDRKRERWAWAAVGLDTGLVVAHTLIAVASGSLVVTAEVAHNSVDLISAGAVLIGLRIASRTSTRFPYGLHKVENLIAAGLAIMVFVTAYEITREAVFRPHSSVDSLPWMLLALLVTMTVPVVFGHFELRAATAARSPALIAQAREYRIHAATTGMVLASLVANWSGVAIDRVAAIIIVAVVAKTGWDLLRDALQALLDASLDRPTLDRIERVILADPLVRQVTWITGRNAGRFRFVEAGVVLRRTTDRGPIAVARIESAVRTSVPLIDRVLLHLEEAPAPELRCAIPLADASGRVSEHFGQAPYFAFVTIRRTDRSVLDQQVVANIHCGEAKAKGIRVAEWLVARKVDLVLTRESLQGRGPSHVLAEAGVDLTETHATNVTDAVNSLTPM